MKDFELVEPDYAFVRLINIMDRFMFVALKSSIVLYLRCKLYNLL